LLASNLPRVLIEIFNEDLEKTAKRIGFEEACHLMFRRGGYSVLVKRTAKYEVEGKDGPTVLGVEAPKTLFPRGILHSSVVAHILVQKFSLGVSALPARAAPCRPGRRARPRHDVPVRRGGG
jgi:hypothetical protein